VPAGVQIACPLMTTSGCPFEVTRVVPVTHCAMTHGGIVGGIPGHPATIHGEEMSDEGMPPSVTRGFGAEGMACPPWRQSTVAPCWMRNPGISNDLHSASIDGDRRPRHGDGGTLTVVESNARFRYGDERSGRGFEENASGWPWNIAD